MSRDSTASPLLMYLPDQKIGLLLTTQERTLATVAFGSKVDSQWLRQPKCRIASACT
jgi:hypothetical protein